MEKETRLCELNENEVLRLPYVGPMSKRIYVVTQNQSSTTTKELFVQRSDAFTIDLVGLLKSVKEREISEIRYSFGLDGFIRIYLTEKDQLAGECSCKSEKTLRELKLKLGIA